MHWDRRFEVVKRRLGRLWGSFRSQLAHRHEMQGRFTLPYEVRWGLATLPPGDYLFKLNIAWWDAPVLRLFRETKGVALMMSDDYEYGLAGPSELSIVLDSAGNQVRDLMLSQIGVVLHYARQKQGPRSGESKMIRNIPVSVVGTSKAARNQPEPSRARCDKSNAGESIDIRG